MAIESKDVRRLLDADDDAVLILLEGRTAVIDGGALDDEAHRGALRIISRAELLKRAGGGDLSEAQVDQQAAELDVEVSELGG
jgi:NADH dehydrogenase